VARQSNAFRPHPGFQFGNERHDARLAHRQTLGCRMTIDLALDGEDRINAPDRFQRQRRDHAGRFALRLAPGIGREISQDEEGSAGMMAWTAPPRSRRRRDHSRLRPQSKEVTCPILP
jgi:hypothetical protein